MAVKGKGKGNEEVSSIIEEGPLKGASIPIGLWAELNGVVVEPLDLEALDDTTSGS